MANYEMKIRRGFRLNERNGVQFLTIPSFEEHGFLRHCFTTRVGGVSEGAFSSLNLSKTREHNPDNKKENYMRICKAIGVSYDSLTLVNYAHGNGVCCVDAGDAGKGIARETDLEPCDAIVTDSAAVTAVTLHADCTPIFFVDVRKRVVCATHAGWKGVYLEIAEKVLQSMEKNFQSDRSDILVGIGPHIMSCCFEVKDDVALPFRRKFGADTVIERREALFVDLQKALLLQLNGMGVPQDNITCAELCTHCGEDLFYSHRRDHGKTGAMGSFITVD